jgi:D-lactate dehydrogenase (cytochrome)
LLAPIVGHVGDGNFHAMPLFDADSTDERRAVQGFLDRLVDQGASHGWHVLGRAWRGSRQDSLSRPGAWAGVEVMVAIKKALDPLNMLNPGKIFGLP